MTACTPRARATAICRCAGGIQSRAHDLVRKPVPTFRDHARYRSLFRFELFLQCGKLGERRVRIGLAAPFLRIDPLARLAAVAILEIAAALAARTIPALPVRAVA